MRLIDADRIKWEFKCISKEEIDEQPTVEAIPIEWISAKVKHHLEQESYQTASAFQWIIDMWHTDKEDWEKENE